MLTINIMKKIYLTLLLCLTCFAICSCGIGKTKMDELDFTKGKRNEVCVIKGNIPYSGEFWSNDGKTIKMVTNEYGIIQRIYYYHPNGKMSFSIYMGIDGYFDDDSRIFYDENGNTIEMREWKQKYDSYFESMIYRFVPQELIDAL